MFCYSKTPDKRMKTQVIDWEEIFINYSINIVFRNLINHRNLRRKQDNPIGNGQ